jgi:hypothetical protein
VNSNVVFGSKMSWGTELWVSSLFHLFLLQLCEGDPCSLGVGRTYTLGVNSFLLRRNGVCTWVVTHVNSEFYN